MKFFLDTANVEKIRKASELGLVDGVTTNPSLIMKEGKDHKQTIQEIAKIVEGPISVEGVGEKAEEMVKDAEEFAKWAPNVVAKVPMTLEGIKALRILKSKGIPTNVTLVFSAAQALLVAKAGANYVSPFIGRLDDIGLNGMELIADIAEIYQNYEFETEVLVASIRTPNHVIEAAKLGADIATMPYEVFEKLPQHALTDKGIKLFFEDYQKSVKEKR